MDTRDLDRLRSLGLTERTADGVEAVRVSAQFQAPLFDHSRAERARILERWEDHLKEMVNRHGGFLVPGSLSMLGQSVEALLPVEAVNAVEHAAANDHTRIDVLMPYDAAAGR